MSRLRSFFSKFKSSSTGKTQQDPVCGMKATTGITSEYNGQTYYFCSNHCREQFEQDPESYVS